MAGGYTRPLIHCEGCGRKHALSAGALAAIIRAFNAGAMQQVTATGIKTRCLASVLDDKRFTEEFADKGRKVVNYD